MERVDHPVNSGDSPTPQEESANLREARKNKLKKFRVCSTSQNHQHLLLPKDDQRALLWLTCGAWGHGGDLGPTLTFQDCGHRKTKIAKEETRGALAQHVHQGSYLLGTTATPQRGRQLSPVAPQSLVLLDLQGCSIPFRDNLLSRLGTIRGYVGAAKENSSKLGVRGVCCCVSQSQRFCNCITGSGKIRSVLNQCYAPCHSRLSDESWSLHYLPVAWR